MSYKENVNNNYTDKLVKDIVASNFRTASVFEKYGIDFCCKGNRVLQTVCNEKDIETDKLVEELSMAASSQSKDENHYNDWDLDYLSQYIINNHHRYLERTIPEISRHLEKVAQVHGKRHPYLEEINSIFSVVAGELLQHMKKEEGVLFPLIRILVDLQNRGGKNNTNIPDVKRPITVMESEHDDAGSILEKIRELSGNFTLPDDACNTFAVTYKELEEFEQDLHKHVFLENGILFPKAIELQENLLKLN